MKSNPMKLGLAAILLAGSATAASAQALGYDYSRSNDEGSYGSAPGAVDPQAEARYEDQVRQYQDAQQRYQDQVRTYWHRQSLATAQRDAYEYRRARWGADREAYERARADYDARYGDGAWEARYGYGVDR
jgi:hypothetical protein